MEKNILSKDFTLKDNREVSKILRQTPGQGFELGIFLDSSKQVEKKN